MCAKRTERGVKLQVPAMPMVVMNEGVNESSLNRNRQHDFPTPESPINNSLICIYKKANLEDCHLNLVLGMAVMA